MPTDSKHRQQAKKPGESHPGLHRAADATTTSDKPASGNGKRQPAGRATTAGAPAAKRTRRVHLPEISLKLYPVSLDALCAAAPETPPAYGLYTTQLLQTAGAPVLQAGDEHRFRELCQGQCDTQRKHGHDMTVVGSAIYP